MNTTSIPAFPSLSYELDDDRQSGMSLRDYFAAKALHGMLAGPMHSKSGDDIYARCAYDLADAMLAARKA